MQSDVEQAVLLLKRGDDQALEEAVALLQKSVFSFSMRVCGHRQDAEDTMQDVLLKSLRYLPKFDNARALASWLYKVAKNRCLMSRRRSKFAPSAQLSLEELMPDRTELERLDSSPIPSPETSASRGEQGRRLREAIRKLPPHHRIVIVLRDMEDLTDEEVAEITGLRPGTVRVRLHRARLFVRKTLATRNERPRRGTRGPSGKFSDTPTRTGRCKRTFAGLSDYLDGQLDDFSCEEIETHLNGCLPCKKFLDSLEATIKRCRQLPGDSPDRQKAAGLRKKLLAAYGRALANSPN